MCTSNKYGDLDLGAWQNNLCVHYHAVAESGISATAKCQVDDIDPQKKGVVLDTEHVVSGIAVSVDRSFKLPRHSGPESMILAGLLIVFT